MGTGLRLENRRSGRRKAGTPGLEETVILRDDEEVAVLVEGDPLRYALELPPEDLKDLLRAFAPVLERRADIRQTLQTIVDFKEEESSARAP